MTCKDCLYYKVCSDFRGNICETDLNRFMEYRGTPDGLCEHFKNKADFVEVVRCKDCKKARRIDNVGNHRCFVHQNTVKGMHFCSHGEKRE